jgi:hypothetical protein
LKTGLGLIVLVHLVRVILFLFQEVHQPLAVHTRVALVLVALVVTHVVALGAHQLLAHYLPVVAGPDVAVDIQVKKYFAPP